VLSLTASGSVSDYDDVKTSALRRAVASLVGVDASAVTISVAAASVIITATIAVPAATTAPAMQAHLATKLGTANAASIELGITVEIAPAIIVAAPPPVAPPPLPPPSTGSGGVDAGMIGGIVGGSSGLIFGVIGGSVYYMNKRKKQVQPE